MQLRTKMNYLDYEFKGHDEESEITSSKTHLSGGRQFADENHLVSLMLFAAVMFDVSG